MLQVPLTPGNGSVFKSGTKEIRVKMIRKSKSLGNAASFSFLPKFFPKLLMLLFEHFNAFLHSLLTEFILHVNLRWKYVLEKLETCDAMAEFSPNSCTYIEALTPHVAIFRNRALKKRWIRLN